MTTIEVLEAIDTAGLARFDAVLDVRSPAEFAEDRLPGAVNLPVLDDAERARIGTIYVQESRFKARRLGAALIARNVARHLETALADKPGGFRPLVYCWRGGQRSGAMATVLSQVGWRTAVLAGGYRTWRRQVVARLYDRPLPHRLVLVDGATGCGKTELLARLGALGGQTLDLEALAAHRGSLFGGLPGQPQPSQKLFESRLLAALDRLDPARPVLVEAESSKIGELMAPPSLWAGMRGAPRIELRAPLAARVGYLLRSYGDLARDPAALDELLSRLPRAPGRKRVAEWRELAAQGELGALAAALVVEHYDPAYRGAARRRPSLPLGVLDLDRLDAAELDRAAVHVLKLMGGVAAAGLEPRELSR